MSQETTLGDRLKAARERAGLTMTELARRLQRPNTLGYVTISYLSKLEAGKLTNPRKVVLDAIARELETDTKHLMTGTGSASDLPSSGVPSSEERHPMFTEAWRLISFIYGKYTSDSAEWMALMLFLERLAGTSTQAPQTQRRRRRSR